jgi:hypothetical protein
VTRIIAAVTGLLVVTAFVPTASAVHTICGQNNEDACVNTVEQTAQETEDRAGTRETPSSPS